MLTHCEGPSSFHAQIVCSKRTFSSLGCYSASTWPWKSFERVRSWTAGIRWNKETLYKRSTFRRPTQMTIWQVNQTLQLLLWPTGLAAKSITVCDIPFGLIQISTNINQQTNSAHKTAHGKNYSQGTAETIQNLLLHLAMGVARHIWTACHLLHPWWQIVLEA